MDEVVRLSDVLGRMTGHWRPQVVGRVNDQEVRLAKVRGEFVRHRHDEADELFLVLRGRMTIRLPGRDVELAEGEMFVVPRGVEHRPSSEGETHLLLIVSSGVSSTGSGGEQGVIDPSGRP